MGRREKRFLKLYSDNDLINRIQEAIADHFETLDDTVEGMQEGGINVGDIKTTTLADAQFYSINSTAWRYCDGSPANGTLWEKLTGLSRVPTVADNGQLRHFVKVD